MKISKNYFSEIEIEMALRCYDILLNPDVVNDHDLYLYCGYERSNLALSRRTLAEDQHISKEELSDMKKVVGYIVSAPLDNPDYINSVTGVNRVYLDWFTYKIESVINMLAINVYYIQDLIDAGLLVE